MSLFHKVRGGQDPLTWDSDELARVRDLHTRGFGDRGEYLASRDLADYLGLGRVDQIHLPLPLHIVFIGFQGDGNARVRLDEAVLTEWFGHLDNLLPHARVALSDVTCADDGHCAGSVGGSASAPAPSPLPSHVRLNFSCNVVAVSRAEVLETYERAVLAFSRPLDPESEGGTRQVDALKLEAFIDSFVEGLGLGGGYSLIVVNPKSTPEMAQYGFRAGFSLDEIDVLQDKVQEMRHISLSHWEGEPRPPRGPATGSLGFLAGGGWDHRSKKMSVSRLQEEGTAWVNKAQAYLSDYEDHMRRLVKAIGGENRGDALTVARAVAMMQGATQDDMSRLLASTIQMPLEHFHNPKWQASHPLEDCLTPLWVGHGRWLLLDLTAQRSDWGPAMGGEGVVTSYTLPDVPAMFSDAIEAREAARDERADDDDSQGALRDSLGDQVGERLARVRQAQAHATQLHGATAHLVTPDGKHLGEYDDGLSLEERHQLALVHAELDVYEQFALEHCHHRREPPVACSDAREAVEELRHEMQRVAPQSPIKAMSSFRDHHWDIFGLEDVEEEHPDVVDAHSRARDHFLAMLSDLLSRGVRHVVAPPVAAWHRPGAVREDTASRYAHKVNFAIHVIQDTSRHLGPWREKGAAFDATDFEKQVRRLALPHQRFSFEHSRTWLLDDPVLAARLALSTRTAFAAVPGAGEYRGADGRRSHDYEVLYIDAEELASSLRWRYMSTPRRGGPFNPHATLDIPVFVFSLDRDFPVLIDEHYNARSLEDMIIIVENAANQDEHPTGFMCDGALMARPLSPLRHALAATLQHLGGVLPPHLGYIPTSGEVTHDWLWSVGAHPLSWTSTGTRYSQLHIDALHRSYILDALDRTVERVNAGVAILEGEKATEGSYRRAAEAEATLKGALRQFQQAVGAWRACVGKASAMDFGGAAEMIAPMEAAAEAFYAACREAQDHLHPKRCMEGTAIAPALLRGLVVGSAAAVAFTLLCVCGPPRRKKKET